MLASPLQHFQLSPFRCSRASRLIPWAAVRASPLKHAQISLISCIPASISVPRTSICAGPLKYFQIPFPCRGRARSCIPRAIVRTCPLKYVQVSSLCCPHAHVFLVPFVGPVHAMSFFHRHAFQRRQQFVNHLPHVSHNTPLLPKTEPRGSRLFRLFFCFYRGSLLKFPALFSSSDLLFALASIDESGQVTCCGAHPPFFFFFFAVDGLSLYSEQTGFHFCWFQTCNMKHTLPSSFRATIGACPFQHC